MNIYQDNLNDLETDNDPIPPEDIKIVEKMFKNDRNRVSGNLKDTFIVGVLFLLFNNVYFDKILHKYMPTKSDFYLVIFKVMLFMLIYWFLLKFIIL